MKTRVQPLACSIRKGDEAINGIYQLKIPLFLLNQSLAVIQYPIHFLASFLEGNVRRRGRHLGDVAAVYIYRVASPVYMHMEHPVIQQCQWQMQMVD